METGDIVTSFVALFGVVGISCFFLSLWRYSEANDKLQEYQETAKRFADGVERSELDADSEMMKQTREAALLEIAELLGERWKNIGDEPVYRLDQLLLRLESKGKGLNVIQERLALITCMVNERNLIRVMPLLDNLKDITQEREWRHVSMVGLSLSSSLVLLVGICGTLWSIEGEHLQQLSLLPNVLKPSLLAIIVCIILHILKAICFSRLETLFTRMDKLTMGLFIPLFTPVSTLYQDLQKLQDEVLPMFMGVDARGRKINGSLSKLISDLADNYRGFIRHIETAAGKLNLLIEEHVMADLMVNFAILGDMLHQEKLQIEEAVVFWKRFDNVISRAFDSFRAVEQRMSTLTDNMKPLLESDFKETMVKLPSSSLFRTVFLQNISESLHAYSDASLLWQRELSHRVAVRKSFSEGMLNYVLNLRTHVGQILADVGLAYNAALLLKGVPKRLKNTRAAESLMKQQLLVAQRALQKCNFLYSPDGKKIKYVGINFKYSNLKRLLTNLKKKIALLPKPTYWDDVRYRVRAALRTIINSTPSKKDASRKLKRTAGVPRFVGILLGGGITCGLILLALPLRNTPDKSPNIPQESPKIPEKQAPKKGKFVTYTVKKGETLSEIVLRYGTDKRSLATLNQLDIDKPLIAGQKLRVPSEKKCDTCRTLEGDTLADIALLYSSDVKRLAEWNVQDTNTTLRPGQILCIPLEKRNFQLVPDFGRVDANEECLLEPGESFKVLHEEGIPSFRFRSDDVEPVSPNGRNKK